MLTKTFHPDRRRTLDEGLRCWGEGLLLMAWSGWLALLASSVLHDTAWIDWTDWGLEYGAVPLAAVIGGLVGKLPRQVSLQDRSSGPILAAVVLTGSGVLLWIGWSLFDDLPGWFSSLVRWLVVAIAALVAYAGGVLYPHVLGRGTVIRRRLPGLVLALVAGGAIAAGALSFNLLFVLVGIGVLVTAQLLQLAGRPWIFSLPVTLGFALIGELLVIAALVQYAGLFH